MRNRILELLSAEWINDDENALRVLRFNIAGAFAAQPSLLEKKMNMTIGWSERERRSRHRRGAPTNEIPPRRLTGAGLGVVPILGVGLT